MANDLSSPVRRALLGAGTLAAMHFSLAANARGTSTPSTRRGTQPVNNAFAKDGTRIFFKDWGTGPTFVFSHGWPLTADAWDNQMLFLCQNGCRVIAHDRRSHGRSGQTMNGNEMNTYADDLETVLDLLGVTNAILVGHSTGGGEVARYIGRHGGDRVAKAVLIGSVPPHMAKTEANPDGVPMTIFDGLRESVTNDRSQFFRELAMPFFGFNRANAKISQGAIESFWMQGMMGGIKGQFDCIKAFSETDFTADLQKMHMPTLVIHGDDDQIVPLAVASEKSSRMLPKGILKVYPGAPHGLAVTHSNQLNADLLQFARS